uniref:BZIP domain-containing protein n=1 Tax=Hyaloperonospora arabidopsidis (strain Emoy2) TaxID=559515 RepID=M4BNC8_HYAAE
MQDLHNHPSFPLIQNAASLTRNIREAQATKDDEKVDDKVLRRRLQYKLHQRRHRAKQKEKAATLDLDVQQLAVEVETLNRRRQTLLLKDNCFASRGTIGGVPARTAMEYFRLFQLGASLRRIDQQEHFLRVIMTPETEGPDYVGVDTIVTQWRRYCNFFAYTRYEPLCICITTVGDLTVVEADSIFSIRARRDGIVTLYPALNGNPELTQRLSGNVINIHVKYRFTFDSAGFVTWFGAEWDLVDALQRTLGSLDDVTTLLSNANMSSSTGKILVEDMPVQETKPRSNPRHDVNYLLS